MNYFELYVGDYARDTMDLSLAEHGAFLLLLSSYYATEKALPADLSALCRIVRAMTPAEQKAVKAVADRFFPVADDGLRHNARADAEITKAQARIETARVNGKKGGRPPKQKPDENPTGFDSLTGSEPSGKAPHTPYTNTSTETLSQGTRAERAAPAVEGSFEGHSPQSATPNPAAPLAQVLNRAGLRCTAINPDLIAYHAEGGTPQHLAEIAAHPDCAGKSATYAIRFARRELTAAAKPLNGDSHAPSRRLSASEQTRAAIAERRARERADAGH